ncbi:hypothetical protein Hypma_012702, partial [Hypsizygus marmoreus]
MRVDEVNENAGSYHQDSAIIGYDQCSSHKKRNTCKCPSRSHDISDVNPTLASLSSPRCLAPIYVPSTFPLHSL